MEKLATYLADQKMTQQAFADLVGVTQPTVNRWLGGSRPSWAVASIIATVTKGAVPVSAWVEVVKDSASLSEAS